jgi:4-hydroxybenzoate polyprenyltransferase
MNTHSARDAVTLEGNATAGARLAQAYFAYTRPRSIPVTLAMALTGWLAAPVHAHVVADLAFLVIVHSVLLWGGTNAFNSAEDRDTGPVNLLPDPPPLPRHLGAFGIALMLAAIGAAFLRGTTPALLVGAAVVLSIFYSWRAPWRRGKDIPGVDNLINALGCGLGSFALGWVATGAPLPAHAVYLGLAWTVCLFGGMPTAQIFQLAPGEHRTNWTSLLGAARTLRLGSLLFAAHFALMLPVTRVSALSLVWALGVIAAVIHSAWWSRSPFTNPYRRMLRQMTVLTIAQLAWALAQS